MEPFEVLEKRTSKVEPFQLRNFKELSGIFTVSLFMERSTA